MFFGHNGIKVEVGNRKITSKFPNTWKLKNILLNNTWVKSKSQVKEKNGTE